MDRPGRALTGRRLPAQAILAYSLPATGIGFSLVLLNVFFMKFATDVLGIAAATMGWIHLLSRAWDAVSDPIAGFLSDRTRTSLGRRRPWMFAAALPFGIVFFMLWSPPRSFEGAWLVAWVAFSFVLLYTAVTAFSIPHDALGAELTTDYVERSRVFGWRRAMWGVGALGAMGGVALLTRSDDLVRIRETADRVCGLAGALSVAVFVYAAARLRERPEHLGRGSGHPFRAVADVWRNRHARLLLAVFFIQQVAVISLTLTAPYYTDYVLGSAGYTAPVLAAFMVCGTVSIPIWIRASRRFEKKGLMILAMTVIAAVMGGFFFLGRGDVPAVLALAALAGVASGGTDTLFPSMQADVIDCDEYRTGERKEGTYFAVWAFLQKTAAGVVGIMVGFALTAAGYRPNVEQTQGALLAIRGLFAGVPFMLYGAGILLFLRFDLTARAHAEIRATLDARLVEPASND